MPDPLTPWIEPFSGENTWAVTALSATAVGGEVEANAAGELVVGADVLRSVDRAL